jgi:hypothetical protein
MEKVHVITTIFAPVFTTVLLQKIQLKNLDSVLLGINNVMLIVMSLVAIQDVLPLRMVLGIVLTILVTSYAFVTIVLNNNKL